MSGTVQELKQAIRCRLREATRRVPMANRVVASAQICQRLRDLPVWKSAGTMVLYRPMEDEPDVWPLAEEALASGRQVGLLRYLREADRYVPCRVESLTGDLAMGRFGVMEPGPQCAELDLKRLDLILVPGIGFTLDGGRLGRGKGYFDRLLSEVPGFKCGVAFDWQIVESMPVEPHDTQLNGILTPSRWQLVSRRTRF